VELADLVWDIRPESRDRLKQRLLGITNHTDHRQIKIADRLEQRYDCWCIAQAYILGRQQPSTNDITDQIDCLVTLVGLNAIN
jgi:hypothetical protein